MSFERRWAVGLWLAAVICVVPAVVRAQQQPDVPIDATTRSTVVDRFIVDLRDKYIFPAKVPALDRALRAKLKAGAYDSLAGAHAFAATLTRDAYTVLQDKHVHVDFQPEGIPQRSAADKPTPDELRRQHEEEARFNYGFERVQRLRGNIGYLDLRFFATPSLAASTLASAMTFLRNTEALIIDLRQNHGGEPETVSLICSYLLAPDSRVHVNDLAMRNGDREDVEQYWTSQVPGPYYLGKPVYVLTGSHTFSGGEEFAYDLKNLKRATLVGETTGGGANPGDFERLTDHFGAFIPSGRAISPITHTNWEGVGVQPDVPTTYADALKTSYLTLLRDAVAKSTDSDRKAQLKDLIAEVEKRAPDQILEAN